MLAAAETGAGSTGESEWQSAQSAGPCSCFDHPPPQVNLRATDKQTQSHQRRAHHDLPPEEGEQHSLLITPLLAVGDVVAGSLGVELLHAQSTLSAAAAGQRDRSRAAGTE